MSESILFARLEGPLQSWGDNSRWTIRQTRLEPTKSGVIGLIACAFGWGLNPEGDRHSAELAQELRMAVRADNPGRVIRDYHTIAGGVLSAGGKIKISASTGLPETVVSERYYLTDARFLVALAGPRSTLESVAHALSYPAWPPFLGRKSCPPSAPFVPAIPGRPAIEEWPSLEAAIRDYPFLAREDGCPIPDSARVVIEPEAAPEGPVYMRQDVPISFSGRRFRHRTVVETTVPLMKGG